MAGSDYCGFATSARSGVVDSFGIVAGTPVEDALNGLEAIGFDHDTVASLRATSAPLAKARHAMRSPEHGRFVPAPVPKARAGLFRKHGGSVLPALLRGR